MKKTRLFKIFLVILLCVLTVLSIQLTAFAVDEEEEDLTSSYKNNTATNTNTNSNTNTNTSLNTNSNNTSNNTNSSLYNNTNLPKTGIGDSIPVVVLIVVFGISAVYAYNKIKEYKNI